VVLLCRVGRGWIRSARIDGRLHALQRFFTKGRMGIQGTRAIAQHHLIHGARPLKDGDRPLGESKWQDRSRGAPSGQRADGDGAETVVVLEETCGTSRSAMRALVSCVGGSRGCCWFGLLPRPGTGGVRDAITVGEQRCEADDGCCTLDEN
jgi:hypothetical protein